MQYGRGSVRAALLAAAVGVVGCVQSAGDLGGAGEPAAGSGGAGGQSAAAGSAGGTAGAGGASGAGGSTVVVTGPGPVSSLSFDVTTASQGGKYSPKNVGAIWIQNSDGAFVRSLDVWAGIRKRDLSKYRTALSSNSDADAVTSATLTKHQTHHVTWDLKDKSGNAVPEGTYTLWVDLSDRDGDGQSMSVVFDTSAGTQQIEPVSSSYYKSMSLVLR